jgi:hypothetical protein
VQDAVNYFFDSVNFSVEAFNGASHLSQTSMWAEALQARLVNRAVVPLPYMWRSISLAIVSSVSIVSIESSHARYDAPLWLAFAVQKLPSSRAGNHRRQSQQSGLELWAVVSQRLILAGERSGLQTRIATMESVWLCTR